MNYSTHAIYCLTEGQIVNFVWNGQSLLEFSYFPCKGGPGPIKYMFCVVSVFIYVCFAQLSPERPTLPTVMQCSVEISSRQLGQKPKQNRWTNKKCLLWFCLDRLSRLKGHIELDWITQNFEASCGDAAKKFYIPQWSVVIAPGGAKKAAMKWLRQKRLEAHNWGPRSIVTNWVGCRVTCWRCSLQKNC